MIFKLAFLLILPATISSPLYCFHVPNNRQLSFHQCSESLASQTYDKITEIYGFQPRRRSSNFFKCVDLNTTLVSPTGEETNYYFKGCIHKTFRVCDLRISPKLYSSQNDKYCKICSTNYCNDYFK
ncbi:hypothetical protein ACFFRR_001653 [Megaselia abdita]